MLILKSSFGDISRFRKSSQVRPFAWPFVLAPPPADGAAFVNQLDDDGLSPLHLAVNNGHGEILAALLEQPGIDANLRAGAAGRGAFQHGLQGSAPLHIAATKGDAQAVQALLKNGSASPGTRDAVGQTCLHTAIRAACAPSAASASAAATRRGPWWGVKRMGEHTRQRERRTSARARRRGEGGAPLVADSILSSSV